MTEEVSQSLRDAIEAAYDAEMAPAETSGPPRDEAGRFAKGEAAPETPAQAEAPEAAPAEEDDYDEAVGLDRETWKLTPAQARERAKTLAKERAEYEQRAKAYEPLDRVLGPRRDALRATWGGEDRAIEQLFHLSDWADRDFPGFVRHLATQRGIDLRALAPMQDAPQQAAQPDVDSMISQRVERILAEREVQRTLQDFERNDAFEYRNDAEIRRVMGGLLQSGAAPDLPTAYQMAVKAHPTISAKLAERESAERAKRERDDAARRAAEKAAASASVKGAPGTSAPATRAAPATVRDAVMQAMEMAGGRV
jgi:hypothetical protein